MEGNELDKYRFPKTLRNQGRWFGLPTDELIPVIIVLIWGLWVGKYIFGIVMATFFFFGIRKLKKGRGSQWLRDLFYWYLPTSFFRGFFHKVPDSCFRQWTK